MEVCVPIERRHYYKYPCIMNTGVLKGEFRFLRPWTLFLDLLLSNGMMVFVIFAFAPVENEGSPKLLTLAA